MYGEISSYPWHDKCYHSQKKHKVLPWPSSSIAAISSVTLPLDETRECACWLHSEDANRTELFHGRQSSSTGRPSTALLIVEMLMICCCCLGWCLVPNVACYVLLIAPADKPSDAVMLFTITLILLPLLPLLLLLRLLNGTTRDVRLSCSLICESFRE